MSCSGNLVFLAICFTVTGCSLFGNDDQSRVRLNIDGNIQLLRSTITVQLNTPAWTKTLNGSDFGTPGAPTYTQTFTTATSGDLEAVITLTDRTGSHISSGTITLGLEPDWAWSITIVLDNRNPYYTCFGCMGYKTVETDTVFQRSASDSLFVVWGGNSIKHPVIY